MGTSDKHYVKFVLCEHLSYETNDSAGNLDVLRKAITDWEEVTTEELELLQRHLSMLWNQQNHANLITLRPVLLVKDDIPIQDRIFTVRKALDEIKQAAAIRSQEVEQKKRERELKKRAKTDAEEKALLKALRERHPDA